MALARGPFQNGPNAWVDQHQGIIEFQPAELIMFRPAKLRADG